MNNWIWQQPNWPNFSWQEEKVMPLLRTVRLKQGILLGKTGAISEQSSSETALDTLLQNIITSSAIENESLNIQSVRSSLAKRLGFKLKHSSHLTDLRDKGCLEKKPGDGRSTRYQIKMIYCALS